MIIYGFMNYAYFSKDRSWKGSRSTMNKYIGSAVAPEFMQKYNVGGGLDHQYASLTCVRYAEHLLGLSPKSIKWPYNYIAQEENQLKTSETGIFSPKFAGATNKEVGLHVPPFNNESAKLLSVNLNELNQHVGFDDITQFKNHKIYLLLTVASFMAMGNRMFFEAASNPDLIPPDYDETKLYKLIMRSTKFHMVGAPNREVTRLNSYVKATILDFTPVLAHSYQQLTQTHPNLHIDDISKLSGAASQFVKNTRLIHT